MKKDENLTTKIEFYFISLWLLFILMAIKNAGIFNKFTFIGFNNIRFENILISLIFLVLSLIALILVKILNYVKFKGAMNPCDEIENIENGNFEIMSFIATYIIPLACINFETINDIVIFILILIVLGIINLKLELYIANPTLSLLGYKIYSVKLKNAKNNYMVISKEILTKGDKVEWKQLDKNRCFVRRNLNNDSK